MNGYYPPQAQPYAYPGYSHSQYPGPRPTSSPLSMSSGMSPFYLIIIIGMVFFLFVNMMPASLPEAQRVMNVAPFMLIAGFFLILLALITQMLGLLPGVPAMHLTYVHVTIAFLLFFLLWNQMLIEVPDASKESSSSSSSSSEKREARPEPKKERKEEKKEDKPDPPPDPWSDMRSHPSAFLTTRLNRLMPWPYPMGKAATSGNELWWESGVPHHVGHFNKPAGAVKEEDKKEKDKSQEKENKGGDKEAKEKEAKEKEKEKAAKLKEMEKSKPKEKEKERLEGKDGPKNKEGVGDKEKEKEKERAKAKAALAEKEAADAKAKQREDEMKRLRAKQEEMHSGKASTEVSAATEARQRQRLWRTKCLAMIVGISMVQKTLGFFLLLFFSLQLLSQELNTPSSEATKTSALASAGTAPTSDLGSRMTGEGAERIAKMQAMKQEKEKAMAEKEKMAKLQALKDKENGADVGGGDDKEKEKEKMAKYQAMKEAEREKQKAQGRESGDGGEGDKEKLAKMRAMKEREKEKEKEREKAKAAASGSSSKERSSSSRASSSSSSSSSSRDKSSSSSKPVTSEAIREASGSKTVTKIDGSGEDDGPQPPIGFGMHYIHLPAGENELTAPTFHTSEGMSHPLMTTVYKGWAN